MWLSESGQTTTILAATSTARRSHVIGARLTRSRARSDRQAATRTNGATHQTSNGRNSRMIGGQRQDGVGDAVLVTGGVQQSSPHGRRNCADEARGWPPACRARTRFATPRCGRRPPGGGSGARARPRDAPAARSAPSLGSTAARAAASSSDGVMAISSERSGALTNTRTCRRPASSVVENIPKPPPFHGLRSGGSGERHLRARHGEQQRDRQRSRARRSAVRARAADVRRHFSTTTWYPVETRV